MCMPEKVKNYSSESRKDGADGPNSSLSKAYPILLFLSGSTDPAFPLGIFKDQSYIVKPCH